MVEELRSVKNNYWAFLKEAAPNTLPNAEYLRANLGKAVSQFLHIFIFVHSLSLILQVYDVDLAGAKCESRLAWMKVNWRSLSEHASYYDEIVRAFRAH